MYFLCKSTRRSGSGSLPTERGADAASALPPLLAAAERGWREAGLGFTLGRLLGRFFGRFGGAAGRPPLFPFPFPFPFPLRAAGLGFIDGRAEGRFGVAIDST